MPYARVSILGMHAASGGVPPNPLETGRIWTRGQLFIALEIPGFFLVLGLVILCVVFPDSHVHQPVHPRSRNGDTACARGPILARNVSGLSQKNVCARRHFMCPST
jgi:hypothetical protein